MSVYCYFDTQLIGVGVSFVKSDGESSLFWKLVKKEMCPTGLLNDIN